MGTWYAELHSPHRDEYMKIFIQAEDREEAKRLANRQNEFYMNRDGRERYKLTKLVERKNG